PDCYCFEEWVELGAKRAELCIYNPLERSRSQRREAPRDWLPVVFDKYGPNDWPSRLEDET
ncbi:unnamed protein product, partial [Timema podura]|nr:unnamed protein product [Timema podura]